MKKSSRGLQNLSFIILWEPADVTEANWIYHYAKVEIGRPSKLKSISFTFDKPLKDQPHQWEAWITTKDLTKIST